ncbi:MAG: DUF6308 family protein [Actinomycetota bacterium]|nr:DUF6308 family protein [Actinomycetota bacterium]
MSGVPIGLTDLLSVVDDPRAVEDLRRYFQPDRAPERPPTYSGSRFEFFAGGGDRPETANRITGDDLVAVTLLSVDVPGDVALQLLEGPLGPAISGHLAQIPTDVSIGEPAASGLLAVGSSARAVWDLLEEPRGMGWVTTSKLLARKRPKLLPVYDGVVRCAYGHPVGYWDWLLKLFATDDRILNERLLAVCEEAGVTLELSALRVLDVIVWMRHRTGHRRNRCPGPEW